MLTTFTRTINASLAAVLAAGALAGPASARSADSAGHGNTAAISQGATRPNAESRPIATPPTWPLHPQPIAPPEATSASARSPESAGFDWGSAGIGAGATFAALTLSLAGVVAVRRRRGTRLGSLTTN
jgi:hypothetical protein